MPRPAPQPKLADAPPAALALEALARAARLRAVVERLAPPAVAHLVVEVEAELSRARAATAERSPDPDEFHRAGPELEVAPASPDLVWLRAEFAAIGAAVDKLAMLFGHRPDGLAWGNAGLDLDACCAAILALPITTTRTPHYPNHATNITTHHGPAPEPRIRRDGPRLGYGPLVPLD